MPCKDVKSSMPLLSDPFGSVMAQPLQTPLTKQTSSSKKSSKERVVSPEDLLKKNPKLYSQAKHRVVKKRNTFIEGEIFEIKDLDLATGKIGMRNIEKKLEGVPSSTSLSKNKLARKPAVPTIRLSLAKSPDVKQKSTPR